MILGLNKKILKKERIARRWCPSKGGGTGEQSKGPGPRGPGCPRAWPQRRRLPAAELSMTKKVFRGDAGLRGGEEEEKREEGWLAAAPRGPDGRACSGPPRLCH